MTQKDMKCYIIQVMLQDILPDGNIQIIRRKDSQVKIRGFRIELSEVEEVIRRYKGIKDATVVVFDETNGGKYHCGICCI